MLKMTKMISNWTIGRASCFIKQKMQSSSDSAGSSALERVKPHQDRKRVRVDHEPDVFVKNLLRTGLETWRSLWRHGTNELRVQNILHEMDPAWIDQLWEPELDWNVPCRMGLMRRGQRLFFDAEQPEGSQYQFAGQTLRSHPMTEALQRLLTLVRRYSSNFNEILINEYQPGQKLGAHQDKEHTLCPSAGVIALTLLRDPTVEGRVFKLTDAQTGEVLVQHRTGHAELLWMTGPEFQRITKHAILSGKDTRRSFTVRARKIKPVD